MTFGDRIEKGDIPAHIQVRDRILDRIHSGDLVPGTKLPPEPELARDLGVSRMTANKSILSLVNEGWLTREKGRGTFVASQSRTVASGHCLVVLPVDTTFGLEDPYFGSLYWALYRRFAEVGIRLDLLRLDAQAVGPESFEQEPIGFIVVDPPEGSVGDLATLGRNGAPVVLLGSAWRYPGVSFVDSDNLLGGALVANHLADLGHERIMFLGACPGDSNTIDRIRGFRTGLRARGVVLDPGEIVVLDEATGIDPQTEHYLEVRFGEADHPTAVFAAGAKIAFHFAALLQRIGLRCPQDVSIVGYDDPDFLSLAYPAITTVRQPLVEMAHRAAQIALDMMSREDVSPSRVVLDPELILRGSTAEPFASENL